MPSDTLPVIDSDSHELRGTLGTFATGVTVVTCCDAAGRPCGVTVNSFSSVSLDPPLVLWNIANVSNSLEAFLNADIFIINVLTDQQKPLAMHFARSDHSLFDTIDYERGPDDAPVLPDTLACFECRRHQVYDGGDHYIIVGEVTKFSARDGNPLLFFRGAYATLENSG